jgi:ABC-type Fe3+/spermidine/putrescine transport system ATPase subunit
MLEVVDLSIRAGSFSLSRISLEVPSSSCHVILGPTGSGKTLILESIIGLRIPERGKIILDGNDITGYPTERRGLAYVPQDLALFPHLSVRENILYSLRFRGGNPGAPDGMILELIEALAIGPVLDRAVSHLSGGERQRTALARAVASGCRTLVLDEPLSALHQSLKKELWLLVKALQQRYDLTTVMVTHDLPEAFFLGDRITIIIDGKLRQQGPKEMVYRAPNSREVAHFLGITNIFSITVPVVNGDSLSVNCPELGCGLKLPYLSRPAAEVSLPFSAVGIRSGHVELLIPGESVSAGANAVAGVIREVYEHENVVTIRAICGPQGATLEAVVPLWSITFRLPGKHLFLIPNTSLQ